MSNTLVHTQPWHEWSATCFWININPHYAPACRNRNVCSIQRSLISTWTPAMMFYTQFLILLRLAFHRQAVAPSHQITQAANYTRPEHTTHTLALNKPLLSFPPSAAQLPVRVSTCSTSYSWTPNCCLLLRVFMPSFPFQNFLKPRCSIWGFWRFLLSNIKKAWPFLIKE